MGNLVRQPGAPGPSGRFKGVIRCPYHSWCYELDGRVRNAPFLGESDAFEPAAFGLYPVAVDTWAGWLFVNLSPERVAAGYTLAAQLGEIPARIARYPLADLRTARRIVYDVRANWKVIVENYNECYHCSGVHPELCRIVPAFREKGGGNLDWDAGVPQAEGTFTFTLTGRSDRAPFPGLDADEQVRHKGELAYPNLMISLSADHVASFMLVPKAPDRTLVVVDWLFHPDEIAKPTFDPSDAVEFWDLVNRQDWAVCEGVQSGMTSRRFKLRLVRADGGPEPRHPALRRRAPRTRGRRGRHRAAGRSRRPGVTRDWDVVVVGLGALGSAAAYWASRRPGRGVLGLERYEIGHHNGASEDVSRIIRRSYHRRDYVRLTARAYETWAEVERESGSQVVFRTGGLDVGPRETAPGVAIDIGEYARSMTAEGVPFEHARRARDRAPLAGLAARRRAPGPVPGRRRARGPVAPATSPTGAWPSSTAPCCASTRPSRGSTARRRRDDRGPRGRRAAHRRPGHRRRRRLDERPARAAGRRPAAHGHPGAGQLVHAARRSRAVRPGPVPGLDLDGRALVLRLSRPTATRAPRSARTWAGGAVTAATRTFERDEAALGAGQRVPRGPPAGMAGEPFRYRSPACTRSPPTATSSSTPCPGHPDVLVALGSAHGYKFASLIGRIMAELALDGATPSAPEIEAFGFGRAALTGSAPAATFVI